MHSRNGTTPTCLWSQEIRQLYSLQEQLLSLNTMWLLCVCIFNIVFFSFIHAFPVFLKQYGDFHFIFCKQNENEHCATFAISVKYQSQCSPKFVRPCRTLGQTESDFLSDRASFCLTGKIGDFLNSRSQPSRWVAIRKALKRLSNLRPFQQYTIDIKKDELKLVFLVSHFSYSESLRQSQFIWKATLAQS